MHPILQNFSLQAGGSHYPSINPLMQEAFARMIIEKCAELAEEADSDPGDCIRNYFGLNNEHTTNP